MVVVVVDNDGTSAVKQMKQKQCSGTQQQDIDFLQKLQDLFQECHNHRQQTCDNTPVAACPIHRPHHQLHKIQIKYLVHSTMCHLAANGPFTLMSLNVRFGMPSDISQMMAWSSAEYRHSNLLSSIAFGQELTIYNIIWILSQAHISWSVRHHLFIHALQPNQPEMNQSYKNSSQDQLCSVMTMRIGFK